MSATGLAISVHSSPIFASLAVPQWQCVALKLSSSKIGIARLQAVLSPPKLAKTLERLHPIIGHFSLTPQGAGKDLLICPFGIPFARSCQLVRLAHENRSQSGSSILHMAFISATVSRSENHRTGILNAHDTLFRWPQAVAHFTA